MVAHSYINRGKECPVLYKEDIALYHQLAGPHSPILSVKVGIHPFLEHTSLQWFHQMKDVNAGITPWYLPLQPVNLI